MPNETDLIGPSEVGLLLGTSREIARRRIERGEIPGGRFVRGRLVCPRAEVERFLRERDSAAAGDRRRRRQPA